MWERDAANRTLDELFSFAYQYKTSQVYRNFPKRQSRTGSTTDEGQDFSRLSCRRGNQEKVISILLKTCLTLPRELEALRNEGLEILQGLPR